MFHVVSNSRNIDLTNLTSLFLLIMGISKASKYVFICVRDKLSINFFLRYQYNIFRFITTPISIQHSREGLKSDFSWLADSRLGVEK
jgi:hypothetical protein